MIKKGIKKFHALIALPPPKKKISLTNQTCYLIALFYKKSKSKAK